jgi:hypothetical protein
MHCSTPLRRARLNCGSLPASHIEPPPRIVIANAAKQSRAAGRSQGYTAGALGLDDRFFELERIPIRDGPAHCLVLFRHAEDLGGGPCDGSESWRGYSSSGRSGRIDTHPVMRSGVRRLLL